MVSLERDNSEIEESIDFPGQSMHEHHQMVLELISRLYLIHFGLEMVHRLEIIQMQQKGISEDCPSKRILTGWFPFLSANCCLFNSLSIIFETQCARAVGRRNLAGEKERDK